MFGSGSRQHHPENHDCLELDLFVSALDLCLSAELNVVLRREVIRLGLSPWISCRIQSVQTSLCCIGEGSPCYRAHLFRAKWASSPALHCSFDSPITTLGDPEERRAAEVLMESLSLLRAIPEEAKPSLVTAVMGQNIQLVCKTGTSPFSRVEWTKDGRPVSSDR